jgi:hypothetical protein
MKTRAEWKELNQEKKSSKVNFSKGLKEIYKELDNKEILLCDGCNLNKELTHSHIIKRSLRPDLITDIKNIKHHCLTCHNKHESNTREMMELNDFWDNLKYIENVDINHFNFLLSKLKLKKCCKCNIIKKYEEFNWRKKDILLRGECKDCQNAYYKIYNEEHSEKRKIYMLIYNKSNIDYLKKYAEESLNKINKIFENSNLIFPNWIENYKGIHEKQSIICNIHGEFKRTPNELIYKLLGCKECNRGKIEGEDKFIIVLNSENIKYEREVSFENHKLYPPCINLDTSCFLYFDFYLPELNILVEIDEKHHKYNKDAIKRDNIKNMYCKNNLISLLRIPFITFEDKELMPSRFLKFLEKK